MGGPDGLRITNELALTRWYGETPVPEIPKGRRPVVPAEEQGGPPVSAAVASGLGAVAWSDKHSPKFFKAPRNLFFIF